MPFRRLAKGERGGHRRIATQAPSVARMPGQLHERRVFARPWRRVVDADAERHVETPRCLRTSAGPAGSPSTPTNARIRAFIAALTDRVEGRRRSGAPPTDDS